MVDFGGGLGYRVLICRPIQRKACGIDLKVVTCPGVMDLPGPPSVQANSKKINTLKRCAQEIARDRMSRDDTWISYLEMREQQDQDNLMLVQMIAR
jgi:hypothetical protein